MRPKTVILIASASLVLAHPVLPQSQAKSDPISTSTTNENVQELAISPTINIQTLKRKFTQDSSLPSVASFSSRPSTKRKPPSASDVTDTIPPPFFNIDRINKPHRVTPPEIDELKKRQFGP